MRQGNVRRFAWLCRRIATGTAALLSIAIAAPSMASAGTVWVSPSPATSGGTSCSSPGFNSIQEAISHNPANSKVHVCAGTYEEQVVIAKPDKVMADPGATLRVPASPVNSTTACDVAEEQDLVTICGAGIVTIGGLALDGSWTGPVNCAHNYDAVLVAGNSDLRLSGSTISHAGAVPINGCQAGIGILVGHARNSQVGSALLKGDLIEGYQKDGVTVDGPGSTAKISGLTIKTAPSAVTAQSGIQVSREATAKISSTTIEGNECNVASCGPNTKGFGVEEWEEAEDATGILFYEGASGSSVKSSTIDGNDIGIYNMLSGASAITGIKGNTLKGNRYWGVAIDEGTTKVDNNMISGPGLVGIQIVQYAKHEQFHEPSRGQAVSAKGTGKADTISGMTQCAVEGLSDNELGDLAATLTLTKSLAKFSGNTVPTCTNNTNGKLAINVG
jgi:nitrous oxidase accessory protein NosD